MKKIIVHLKTPGAEEKALCGGYVKKDHKMCWSPADCTCGPCKTWLRTHPQLQNLMMAARQTTIPGTE